MIFHLFFHWFLTFYTLSQTIFLWQGTKMSFFQLERLVPSTDNQWFPLLNKVVKSDICCRLDLYTFNYTVKLFLNIFCLGTHICSIKHQYKIKRKTKYTLYILSKPFDNLIILTKSTLRNYYKYKNGYYDNSWIHFGNENDIYYNSSTIGIKFFSGKKTRVIFFRYFLSC